MLRPEKRGAVSSRAMELFFNSISGWLRQSVETVSANQTGMDLQGLGLWFKYVIHAVQKSLIPRQQLLD
jgi:hypothetical protein